MSAVVQPIDDDSEPMPDIKFTITITARPSIGQLEMPIPPQALSVLNIHPDTEVTVDFDDERDPQMPTLKIKRVDD